MASLACLESSPWAATAQETREGVLELLPLGDCTAWARTCSSFRADFDAFAHWAFRYRQITATKYDGIFFIRLLNGDSVIDS